MNKKEVVLAIDDNDVLSVNSTGEHDNTVLAMIAYYLNNNSDNPKEDLQIMSTMVDMLNGMKGRMVVPRTA